MPRRLLHASAPTLQRRLAILVVGVLAPFAVLACWLVLQGYRNERAATELHLVDTARTLSLLVEAELREREARLNVLASSPYLVTGDLAAFRIQAMRVTKPGEQWVILVDDKNQQLLNTGVSADTPLPLATPIVDAETSPYLGESYISNLRIGAVSKMPVLFLTQPVRDSSAVQGRLQLSISPRVFTQSLADHRIAGGWLVALIDREGTIAARSREADRFVGHIATADMREHLKSGHEGVVESTTLDGIDSLTAFHRSSLSGWTIVVAAPAAIVRHSSQRLLAIGLGSIGAVGLLAVLFSIWVARSVVGGVHLLMADTNALAHGGLLAARSTGMRETDLVSQALAATSREIATRQTELGQARDDAISASLAKDQFLAALSHELRTPLNPVLLLASEGAADQSLPPAIRQTFAIIEKNVGLEARLIDDLLDLTRIIGGKMVLHLQPVQLDTVIRDSAETLQGPIAEKQLNLRLALAANATVTGDPARLQQVFSNLLINAIKFTPKGGSINVSSRADPARSGVVIEVSDTGIGMTPEEIARIFERFAQGDHARGGGSHQFGGLGLGLVITRNIVETHFGRIEAYSAGRNKGSRFTVFLPTENPGATK